MSNKKITMNNRGQKLRLPFENRPTDVGSWSYDHRFGLCVTVIFFLLIGIVVLSVKIRVKSIQVVGYVLNIQIPELDIIEPKPEPKPKDKVLTREDFSDVKNAISNEQAEESDQDSESQDEFKESLLNEAKDAVEGTSSNREAYEQGLRDEQAIIDSKRNKPKEAEKRENVKVAGNVTVSFSFVDPIRQSVDHDVPAYMCEGGGTVVINATVNHNGDVVAASVDKKLSTSDECITSTALKAAKGFRFNVDSSAPNRHQGTIKYIFIPQ